MNLESKLIVDTIKQTSKNITELDLDNKVEVINELKLMLHEISPFKSEPVDCVVWIKNTDVHANDYNPNSVAPPEMELLRLSIGSDGYTQPIVTMDAENKSREVIDGFHRNRVGKECEDIQKRVHGYLPVVTINSDRKDKNDRMASTIRHNRARGKHNVDSMSDIVVELKRRNWKNERIMRELGMDEDEVLRLCQITGMQELFSDQEFSASWDVDSSVSEDDFEELTDDIEEIISVAGDTRVVNSDDDNRVFHTYDKWECHKAGFYATTADGMTKPEAEEAYSEFLSDNDKFSKALDGVITEWKYSCEHYLTNSAMNRIAWLGQAAACYSLGLSSKFRSGFSLLSPNEQDEANKTALIYLNDWLVTNDMDEVNMDGALSGGRQSDIY